MAQKKGYDVLRFIEHGKGSYISSTYVEGVTLFQWLSEAPTIKKRDCFAMLQEIAKQLELLHKGKGSPVYQYVNPYCIVISEDQHLYLLDMKAESSSERLRKMQSRKIRERFLPTEDPYYQNATIGTDLFGFGRTLQYMMAAVHLTTPLTRREERRIKKVINRCLARNPKKTYDSIEAMRKHLPYIKEEKQDYSQKVSGGRKRAVFLLLIAILSALAFVCGRSCLGESHPRKGEMEECSVGESLSLDENVESKGEVRAETDPEFAEEETGLYEALSKAQGMETLGRYLEAADLYQEILISLEQVEEKEKLYERTASLYMKLGNYDKAYEVLQFGMSELFPSDYLWQTFLDLLTNNTLITDEEKMEYVNRFQEMNSGYEKKKYKKLLEEASFYQTSEAEGEGLNEKEEKSGEEAEETSKIHEE
ncbi:MAG: hypothetical protein MJ097_06865 [Dorea sp.]|nr:hypothetical protein [Dorea sp.]